ncbi:hypothetical protein ABIC09_002319 [Bradyrhizobium sp. S3.12.5]|uniref:caspase family protein n=1 Tax=Bradyrhizobium sp. S3.12.5 TaxID=3156386 RepID=UPI003395D1BD
MRKALIVGIDHYQHINPLKGAVNDAYEVKGMLERHADSSVNFGCKLMVGTGPSDVITRVELKDAVKALFEDDTEISLFYFAGHGYIEPNGGYLCAGDCKTGDDGVPLSDVMSAAINSPASNKIIILDSCHSGALGQNYLNNQVSEIGEGMTILTASTKSQYAMEKNGGGLFTGLLVDALGGAASNLVGEVTPGSVYAHIDQSLGSWSQRPVFKTNVNRFVSLRKIQPPLPPEDLRRIKEFFPTAGHEFQLDPGYEPEHPNADSKKTPIFEILQKYNRVNLAVPVGTKHPYHAAIESKTMRLTALGEHYRRLVEDGLL